MKRFLYFEKKEKRYMMKQIEMITECIPDVFHHVMKLYSLGMGIKATLVEGLRISLTM
jgi:hypothetical protein